MANRYGSNYGFTLQKEVWNLYLRATIGNTGAPTLVPSQSKGIQSITRFGVGAYKVQFGTIGGSIDVYPVFLWGNCMFDDTTNYFSGGTSLVVAMEGQDIGGVGVITQGNIAMICYGNNGLPSEIPSGMAIQCIFAVGNSTAY